MKQNLTDKLILQLTEENIQLKLKLNEEQLEKVGTQTRQTTRYWEAQFIRLSCFVNLINCLRNNVKDATAEEKLESIDSCLISCLEIIEAVKNGTEWVSSQSKFKN